MSTSEADMKRERNREYQRKHRENKIAEIGKDEFRKQVAEQVAQFRANKKDDDYLVNRVKDIINKIDNDKLKFIYDDINGRFEPEKPNKERNNTKYCSICDSYVSKSNFARHVKSAKHTTAVEQSDVNS